MAKVRKCIDSTVNFMTSVTKLRKPPGLPPIKSELCCMPAHELAVEVAFGRVKSYSIVSAFIDRIKQVNDSINAVVDERFQDALQEAENIDKSVASISDQEREELLESKPLLGIPVTTKNLVSIKGLLLDVGIVARRGTRSDDDADVIKMVRKAGAIPLALTNVSEIGMWWESNNKVHGRTRNPYDTRRNAGGSSGGEGALLGAAGSVIGIGTDIGGSIRMPAFFNGVFGHKPSQGLVSNGGQYPEIVDVQAGFLSTGPMCRYATDLKPMLSAMAGPEKSELMRLGEKVDMSKIKIYYMDEIKNRGCLLTPVTQEVKTAINDVVNHFSREFQSHTEEKNFIELAYSFEIWNVFMMSGNCPKFGDILRESGSSMKSPSLEMLKWMFGCSDHTLPAVILAFGENFMPSTDSNEGRRNLERGMKLRQEFMELLADKDAVFICPTHPEAAPRHGAAVFRGFNFCYTAIFNVLQLPVTACPVRLGERSGLPVGLQVVAGPNQDRLCLAIAVEIEKAFGGWRDPSIKEATSSINTAFSDGLHSNSEVSSSPPPGDMKDVGLEDKNDAQNSAKAVSPERLVSS